MKNSKYFFRISAMMSVLLLAACTAKTAGTTGPYETQPAASSTAPVATLAPAVTPEPNEKELSVDSYHVLYNGAMGVVDSHGKVIIPFIYSEIDVLFTKSGKNGAGNKGKALFFAKEYVGLKKDSPDEGIEIPGYEGGDTYKSVLKDMHGYLLTDTGERAFKYKLKWATQISDTLIAAAKEGTSQAGVMNFFGKAIIPFNYINIYPAKKTIAAVRLSDGQYWMDFFDTAGKMKGSLQIGGADVTSTGYSWIARGTNRKYGFVGVNMKWICAPKYSHIYAYDPDDIDSGQYQGLFEGYISEDEDYSNYIILNQYGRKLDIPDDAEIMNCVDENYVHQEWKGHLLYFVRSYNDTWLKLINDEGKVLFESDSISDPNLYNASFNNGIVIADSKAFDLSGKDILPGASDVQQWIAEDQLYVCATAVYTADGKKMPLPDAESIEHLAKDRYLIVTTDGRQGIFDGKGSWIIEPSSDFPSVNQYRWPVFSRSYGYEMKYGLMDTNGRIVYDSIFDDITPTADGLYEVWYGNYHGLIDADSHWIWYATIYSSLDD